MWRGWSRISATPWVTLDGMVGKPLRLDALGRVSTLRGLVVVALAASLTLAGCSSSKSDNSSGSKKPDDQSTAAGMTLQGQSRGRVYMITGAVLLLAASVDAISRRRAAASGRV